MKTSSKAKSRCFKFLSEAAAFRSLYMAISSVKSQATQGDLLDSASRKGEDPLEPNIVD